MELLQQTLIAFALTLDSFFVMAYIAMAYSDLKVKSKFFVITIFTLAIVQTLFAYLGITIGHKISGWIQFWDHWVIFLFFSYLAWKQWNFDTDVIKSSKKIKYSKILILAMMCSLDAFVMSMPIVDLLYGQRSYLWTVFLLTLILSILGPIIFGKIKLSLWYKSSKIAALIIFLLGFKILLEHLL